MRNSDWENGEWRAPVKHGDSIEVEADSKKRLLIIEHFGLEDESNLLTAPAIKEDVVEDEGELTKEESTGFRRLAARPNYLAVDRADIQSAVKTACCGMSEPGEGELRRMKRLTRHLKGAKATTVVGSSNPEASERLSFTSTAIGTSRKSTSGGVLVVEGMLVESWGSTRATVATSSGEIGLCWLVSPSRLTGRSDQTQVLPRTVVRTCSWRSSSAGWAAGGWVWREGGLVSC